MSLVCPLKPFLVPDDTITVIGADAEIIATVKEKYGLDKINHYEPPFGLRHKPDEVAKTAEFIAENPARYDKTRAEMDAKHSYGMVIPSGE